MATASSSRLWAGVAGVLALVAVVGASSLTVFEGPGCWGYTTVVSCGSCQTIKKQGGYYFIYTGGSADFYSSDDCSGIVPADILTETTLSCESFTYKSVNISCSDAAATATSSWDITARRQQQ